MDEYLIKSIIRLRNLLDSPTVIDVKEYALVCQAYFYASNQGIVRNVDNYIKKEKNK